MEISEYIVPFTDEAIKVLYSSTPTKIVRCKDCRFHEHHEPGMVWCPNVVGAWMTEEGYCSMGERREDGKAD